MTMKKSFNQGLAIDSDGNPVVDPTANVIALVEAANLRQDDLRQKSDQISRERFSHIKEMMRLHARYEAKLSKAESQRLDAIRTVDVQAFKIQNERQASQADGLRIQVQTVATTLADQQRQQADEINKRLAAIEKLQYEGQGKSSLTDPLLTDLVQEIKSLRKEANQTQGRGKGISDFFGWIVGGIAVLYTVFDALNK
jgi:hypothetical protein